MKELTEASAKTATQNAGEVKMKEARQGRDGSLVDGRPGKPVRKDGVISFTNGRING